MCPPPPPKRNLTPAPVKAPQIELGNEGLGEAADLRIRKARGRNQLRSGLNTSESGSGLAIPLPSQSA